MLMKEGLEGAEKSEEVLGVAAGGWVEGWTEEGGDHEAVDRGGWCGFKGLREGLEDPVKG